MKLEVIRDLFLKHQEPSLSHRYITNNSIKPLLDKLEKHATVETIGESVLKAPIYSLKMGYGEKRILMWSQMHGNESTTTKAVFDLLNTLLDNTSGLNSILETCTLYIIPILNPDGAAAYTRINANEVDLNRDAQNLTQPESQVLRAVFNSFKPHFCYNLHGQRTIFSAGTTNKLATVSFLAPAQDESCTVTPNRKKAMEVIAVMNKALQTLIPGGVGVYDDSFNFNCVGDAFQCENVPTILFEAGHYPQDYGRDKTREFIYISYITSLKYISENEVSGDQFAPYFEIPENDKCFYDIIIRNAKFVVNSEEKIMDIGILYQEKLINDRIEFLPKIDKIENLNGFYGHKEFDAKGLAVQGVDGNNVQLGYENVFVIINNEKTSLLLK
ncbi:M14 family zinc carboxypeptidase [Algibacter miyuki]|uniref:M14 family zinc carboxypeptidase n=1 Tax=Algibacter miyuki TaxID=1306933 RepID=A0ABV5GYP2_9FLAO|nr:M14 family zinc carboxypeptidase [Algibacter miyuki]MDN3667133.1 M14 family zinc carboxypeptidase [Algibacter miyuki]